MSLVQVLQRPGQTLFLKGQWWDCDTLRCTCTRCSGHGVTCLCIPSKIIFGFGMYRSAALLNTRTVCALLVSMPWSRNTPTSANDNSIHVVEPLTGTPQPHWSGTNGVTRSYVSSFRFVFFLLFLWPLPITLLNKCPTLRSEWPWDSES